MTTRTQDELRALVARLQVFPRETEWGEFKQPWHDGYLKWICGFANAQGGKLSIGVDDAGNAVGVDFRPHPCTPT